MGTLIKDEDSKKWQNLLAFILGRIKIIAGKLKADKNYFNQVHMKFSQSQLLVPSKNVLLLLAFILEFCLLLRKRREVRVIFL